MCPFDGTPWTGQYDGDDVTPLLDNTVLYRLREELDDDEGVWKVFIHNFMALLPARTENLRLALTTGDAAGAKVALLSLKTSSQMVGAQRLADLLLELEWLLREGISCGDPSVVLPRLAVAHLTPIKHCAEQTTYFLKLHL